MTRALTTKLKIQYALGQLGWSILVGIVSSYLVYYYFPVIDTEGKTLIPHFLPQTMIFGVFSVVSIIFIIDRFIGAISDPLIAHLSDNYKGRGGRRLPFMKWAVIPFALTTILVFVNPINAEESIINAIFLAFSLFGFYFFFALYVTPYIALIPEITENEEERISISTMISITWFIGLIVATLAPVLWDFLMNFGFERVLAVRIAIGILALVAFIFLLIPIFTIDEHQFTVHKHSEIKFFESIKQTFQNNSFRSYILLDFFYQTSQFMFQMILLLFITGLLKLPESYFPLFTTIFGVLTFAFYIPAGKFIKTIGKKKMMIIGFSLFIIAYGLASLFGLLPFSAFLQAGIVITIAAIPMAIFGILPNVIVSNLALSESNKSDNIGMYFGVRTFLIKFANVFALFIMSALLTIRHDGSNEIGIRLCAIAAIILCLISVLLTIFLYKETSI